MSNPIVIFHNRREDRYRFSSFSNTCSMIYHEESFPDMKKFLSEVPDNMKFIVLYDEDGIGVQYAKMNDIPSYVYKHYHPRSGSTVISHVTPNLDDVGIEYDFNSDLNMILAHEATTYDYLLEVWQHAKNKTHIC